MTLQQSMEIIGGREHFTKIPGLQREQQILQHLGNPQQNGKFVHVAGTNGKGTACTLMASVLCSAGYKTGLYTSPYVLDFRERFRINGEMISPNELCEETERVFQAEQEVFGKGKTLTEFEFITALAFCWFSQQKCDVVVLEVGLGGRFDATNVIKAPEVAMVMSIGLDHTAILGDTCEKIAAEKAGIIKEGTNVVLYPQEIKEAKDIIQKQCEVKNAVLHEALPEEVQVQNETIRGSEIIYQNVPLYVPFTGKHQIKNACTVLKAICVLRERGFQISDSALQNGFFSAFIPARMEILGEYPLILLDGGHNPPCAKALANVLQQFLSDTPTAAVLGMMRDKDSRLALSVLAPHLQAIFTVTPDNPRALSAEELAAEAKEFCSKSQACDSVYEAVCRAEHFVGKNGAVIVGGSFYLASEIRPLLLQKQENLIT